MKSVYRIALYFYIILSLFLMMGVGASLVASTGFEHCVKAVASSPLKSSKSNGEFPNQLVLRQEFDLDANRSYRLPIIMYHSTFCKKPGKFNVPPEQIEKDFAYLQQNGYHTVTVADLVNFTEKGVPLPDKPIMLTFDDGYTNNYLYMFPLLKRYEHKCIIGIIGALTDRNYQTDGEVHKPSYAHMDYQQIAELASSGIVEIQNHTYNMHHYGGKRYGLRKTKTETAAEYEQKLVEDLTKLDQKLLDNCGVKTTAVVYPFGAYSKETVGILKKMGYKASFTCCNGINHITHSSSLFNLKRINRPYGKTSQEFFETALGSASQAANKCDKKSR